MARKETGKTGAGKAAAASKTNKAKKENEMIVTADVNVRAEPRIGAEIIKILSAGDSVTVTQRLGEWLRIENGERLAYVMAKYVGEEADAAAEEAEPAAEEAEPAAEEAEEAAEPGADEAEAAADE